MIAKLRPMLLSLAMIAAGTPALADNDFYDQTQARNNPPQPVMSNPGGHPAPEVYVPPNLQGYPMMSDPEIRRTLGLHGYRDVEALYLDSSAVYHTYARDAWGRPMRLAIRATDGWLLDARPAWR